MRSVTKWIMLRHIFTVHAATASPGYRPQVPPRMLRTDTSARRDVLGRAIVAGDVGPVGA